MPKNNATWCGPAAKGLPRWPRLRHVVLSSFYTICVIGILSIGLRLYADQNSPGKQYPKIFRFGVLNLLAGVNQKDAQVAIEMNFVRRNKDRFPGISAELEILDNVESGVRMLQQKRLHGIALSGIDFLSLKELVPVNPLFISSRQNAPVEAYVLLTPNSVESIEQLSRLPERRLMMENFGQTHIGQLWLDTVLWEESLRQSKSFFTSIRYADKPTRIVLPVFFGQAEACLVPESTYDAMIELNPQLGHKIRILMRSPEFVRSITCASVDLGQDMLDALRQNAIKMPNTVDGQQLMMIFQYKRHFLYNPEYMRETERIYRLYKEKIPDSKLGQ